MMHEAMRAARAAAGLSAKELAEMSGVGASTIRQWEQNKGNPSVFLAACVCDVLGISIDEYIGRNKEVKA